MTGAGIPRWRWCAPTPGWALGWTTRRAGRRGPPPCAPVRGYPRLRARAPSGFDEMGGDDNFATETLEAILLKHGCLLEAFTG